MLTSNFHDFSRLLDSFHIVGASIAMCEYKAIKKYIEKRHTGVAPTTKTKTTCATVARILFADSDCTLVTLVICELSANHYSQTTQSVDKGDFHTLG